MEAEQNERLFKSIFGCEMEEFENMIELDGKILKLQGRRTPKLKEPAVYVWRSNNDEVTH